ncbi:MAG TPA: PsiF family protein [Burkholderiales bacterium]|nr:PsiF family protein [Burkholderiales bacterium]
MMALVLATAAVLSLAPAHAKDERLTAQQERVRDCNAQANRKRMKGDERQDFMSSCLRSHGDAPRKFTAQQDRMRNCNRAASERELKGDERREFMRDCLKDDTAAAGGRR